MTDTPIFQELLDQRGEEVASNIANGVLIASFQNSVENYCGLSTVWDVNMGNILDFGAELLDFEEHPLSGGAWHIPTIGMAVTKKEFNLNEEGKS